MPDETHETRNTASPYSTGGGGTRLEHRLGTVFLVRLLTAGPVLELGERAPDRVAFQQSPATSVDDLVATTSAVGGASVRLEIAVRRRPKFIRSDQKTKELVAALVRAALDAERDSDPLVERRLAVAVSGHQTHAQEIAELAVVLEVSRRPTNSSNSSARRGSSRPEVGSITSSTWSPPRSSRSPTGTWELPSTGAGACSAGPGSCRSTSRPGTRTTGRAS